MKVKTNLVGGILFIILFGIILALIPSQIKMPVVQSAGVNPQLMPRLVSYVILGCGVLLIIQSLVFKKENIVEIHFRKEESTALIVALIMIVFTVLIIKVGFIIGACVMAISLLAFYGVRKVLPYIIVCCLTTGIYFLFVGVFHIGLPGIGGL